MQGVEGALSKGLAGPASAAGATAGAKSGKQFGNRFAKTAAVAQTVKRAAIGTAAAVGGVAIAGKKLYDVGKTFDEVRDIIVTGTGASGKSLKGLQNAAENIATTVPVSFEQAATAVADLNTLTGATGPIVQKMGARVLDASRMLGEDGTANTKAFGQALKQWQVPADEGAAKADVLFAATQKFGVGMGEITGHLNTYGSVLKNADFTMEESAAMFGQLESSGISVSRIMPGLNAAFRNWSEEGKNSQEELAKTTTRMKEAGTSSEALKIATEAFGAEGAQRMTTAVRSGNLELSDLSGMLDDADGVIQKTSKNTRSFSESWQILKNKGMKALKPLAMAVFDALTSLANWMINTGIPALQAMAGWFSRNSNVMKPLAAIIGGVVGALVTLKIAMAAVNLVMSVNPIGMVVLALAGLAAGLVYAYNKSETFRAVVQAVWSGVQTAVSTAWSAIKAVFGALRTAVSALATAFSWFWNSVIKPVWAGIAKAISLYWNYYIKPVFTAIKFVITNIVAPTLRWLWNTIVEPIFRLIGNHISTTWNMVIKPIFDLIKWVIRNVLGPVLLWLWQRAKTAFDNISSAIQWAWRNVIRPAFTAIKSGIRTVGDVFGSVRDTIEKVWNKIRGIVKKPVKFVVNTVLNGLIGAWNDVVGFLKLKDKLGINEINLGFASGGIAPGYTPGRDTQLAAVSGGEAIMRPEWTKAAGSGYVHAANAAARSGGVNGASKFIQRNGMPGFALGGIVDWIGDAAGTVGNIASGAWNGIAEIGGKVLDFATDPIGGVRKLMDSIVDKYKDKTGGIGKIADMAIGWPKRLVGGMVDAIKANWSPEPTGGSAVAGARPAGQWAGVASKALRMLGMPQAWLQRTLQQIMIESGGNPNAFNDWDINARRGTPSMGLLQTIGPTFRAHKLPGYGNITAPLDNILAALRYTVSRYGSIPNIWPTRAGYDNGGPLMPGQWGYNGTNKPENVRTRDTEDRLERKIDQLTSMGRGETHVHLSAYSDRFSLGQVLDDLEYGFAMEGAG